jgi:hypothetical protein
MALYGLGRLSEAVEKLKQAARTEIGEPEQIRIREVLTHVTDPEEKQQSHPLSTTGDTLDFKLFEFEKSPFEELQKSNPSEDMLEPQWQ